MKCCSFDLPHQLIFFDPFILHLRPPSHTLQQLTSGVVDKGDKAFRLTLPRHALPGIGNKIAYVGVVGLTGTWM